MAPRAKKVEKAEEAAPVEEKKKTTVKKRETAVEAEVKPARRGRKPGKKAAEEPAKVEVTAAVDKPAEKADVKEKPAAKRPGRKKKVVEAAAPAEAPKAEEPARPVEIAAEPVAEAKEEKRQFVPRDQHQKRFGRFQSNSFDSFHKNPEVPFPTMVQLFDMEAVELVKLAVEEGITDIATHSKNDVVEQLMTAYMNKQGMGFKLCSGVLDILNDGYGFLRQETLLPGPDDIYVSQAQIKRFALRNGDSIIGIARPSKEKEKYYNLVRVEMINDLAPDVSRLRPTFSQMTPIFPDQRITMETTPDVLATRLIDLFAPIGRGQRGLIVAPPKAGKTMLLKSIANAVEDNYKDIHVIVCLIGERPEEVTDMKRSVKGEVIAATFDEAVENQTRVAELAIEKAKLMVDAGKVVFLLLDGITRLTRAYNLSLPPSGRTLSGGIDPVALHPGKRFFGAARNIEEGGSLTIVATCLVDTGSRMDDLIYEEFKGTGNMELHLDRKLAERGTFPAVDITRSSTRRDEFLYDKEEFTLTRILRRMVAAIATDQPNGGTTESSQRVIDSLKRTPNNKAFLESIIKDRKAV
jgi:transcription termination factor Rho